MSQIISHRQHVNHVEYVHNYDSVECPGAGFSFPCDENGFIDESKLQPPALESLRLARAGVADGTLVPAGVQVRSWSWVEPAMLRCDCGATVALDGFTNTCDACETDYNMSGQRLAPREFWGEETGESLADIFAPSGDDWG